MSEMWVRVTGLQPEDLSNIHKVKVRSSSICNYYMVKGQGQSSREMAL